MKIISLVLLFSIGAWAMDPLLAAGETLYIAPTGSDAWSGTLSKANVAGNDGPMATLDGARLAIRSRIAKGLKEPIVVQIRGGEYPLDRTVVFGSEDSGTEKCPITYQAYCLYFDAVTPSGVKPGDLLIPSADPNRGKVGLQFGDPMFDQEAMKKRTYIASSPDRPAKKLGIRPLDLSKVGSTVHDPPTPAH